MKDYFEFLLMIFGTMLKIPISYVLFLTFLDLALKDKGYSMIVANTKQWDIVALFASVCYHTQVPIQEEGGRENEVTIMVRSQKKVILNPRWNLLTQLFQGYCQLQEHHPLRHFAPGKVVLIFQWQLRLEIHSLNDVVFKQDHIS